MTMSSKIIRIVNLNEYTTEEYLQQFLLMSVCVSGKIENIFIRKDELLNLIYAYVVFQHDSDAKTAVSCLNGFSCNSNVLEVELIGPTLPYIRFKRTASFDIQNNTGNISPKVIPTTTLANPSTSTTKSVPLTSTNQVHPLRRLTYLKTTTNVAPQTFTPGRNLHKHAASFDIQNNTCNSSPKVIPTTTLANPSTSTTKSVPLTSTNQVHPLLRPTYLKTTRNVAPQTLTPGRNLHSTASSTKSAVPSASVKKPFLCQPSSRVTSVTATTTGSETRRTFVSESRPVLRSETPGHPLNSVSSITAATTGSETRKTLVSEPRPVLRSETPGHLLNSVTSVTATTTGSETRGTFVSEPRPVLRSETSGHPLNSVPSVTAATTGSETRSTFVSEPKPVLRSATPGHPLSSTSSFKGTSTPAQVQKNINFQTVKRKSQIPHGKEVKQCIIS